MLPEPPHRRLAFVDVETTGLDPAVNRITEIGIIAVDGDHVEEWTTLVDPLTPARALEAACDEAAARREAAPAFRDIAGMVAALLAGRLFVAHNARFDYAFLRAEFERAGIAFEADVVCSVMLSRKLHPDCAGHDLDALMERHGLIATARHRALPDAGVVWQFWQAIHRHHAPEAIAGALDALRAGPVLPADLDPALIERLPESPGVFCLHDEHDETLVIGPAGNVRRRVLDYFRLDVASRKALALAHRVRKITWRPTRGPIGARLQAAILARESSPPDRLRRHKDLWTWRFNPDAEPCMVLASLDTGLAGDSYGVFDSPRKARNALARLAAAHDLHPAVPGLPIDRLDRAKHLTRLYVALRPWRLPAWPFAGPVGIRERGELHIVDRWHYLGTARNESEIPEVLRARPHGFDKAMLRLLDQMLARVAPTAIVRLERYAQASATADAAIG